VERMSDLAGRFSMLPKRRASHEAASLGACHQP
jgi:hypothetical protein